MVWGFFEALYLSFSAFPPLFLPKPVQAHAAPFTMSFPPAACTYSWDPYGFCDPTVTQNTKSIQFEEDWVEKNKFF